MLAPDSRDIIKNQTPSLRSRRVRFSDNVPPVFKGSMRLCPEERERIFEGTSSSVFADIDLSKEKRGLRKELKGLHQLLTKCISDSSMGVALKAEKNPVSIIASKGKYSPESGIVIMQLIRRAVDLEISGVFTDHGQWISMRTFLMEIQTLMDMNPNFSKLMDGRYLSLLKRNTDFYENQDSAPPRIDLKKLPLPAEAKKLDENEQRIVRLLQKLYPYGTSKKERVDPVNLLLVYPKYITTERLFELILLMFKASNTRVPEIQKQRLLCFCRIWISRGYHLDIIPKAKVQSLLNRIIAKGLSSKDPITRDLADDLLHTMNVPLHVRRYWFKEGEQSSLKLMDSLEKENRDKTAELFAEDIFRMSQGLILNIPLFEMLKKSNQTVYQKAFSEYFEQLAFFVKFTVLSPVHSKGGDSGDKMFYLRLSFWIKVAFLLKEKGDFYSALAIVSALNNVPISRLFCKTTDKGVVSTDKRVSKKTFKRWKKLDALFSPLREFGKLRDEVLKRVESRFPVIPYTGIFFSQYNHTNDANPELVDGEINLERLEVIAKLLRRFLGNLKFLKMNREIHSSQILLKTDLNQQLGNEVKEPEFDFWEVSKTLKPFSIS